MGLKWLVSISKAMTSVGSLMTAVTGTMQAAQQQKLVDDAWDKLLYSPDSSVVSKAPAELQDTPMDALQSYLDRAGVSAPVSGAGGRTQPAAQSAAPQVSLAQGQEESSLSQAHQRGSPMEQAERPWEMERPASILHDTVQNAGEGLTGGKQAEAQEKAKEVQESIHADGLYGAYEGPPQRGDGQEKQLAVPQNADGIPPKILSKSQGNHFQGTYTLKPNHTYTANGATYHTDGNGAIQSWSATLTGPQQAARRSPSHQKHLPGKLEGDHAGHYLAASEGGSGLTDNLAPMAAKVNTRDYRAFERENHELLEKGYTLRLEGSSHMGSSDLRPDGIMVTRSVYNSNGDLQDREYFSWTNTDMSQYQENDFGAPDIPNAMDESLEKAGITREEIAALEETEGEKKTAKPREQSEKNSQNQAGENLSEQTARTDGQAEKAKKPAEQNLSDNKHSQPVSQEEKALEESKETPRQETDAARATPQLEQKRSGKDQTELVHSGQQTEKANEHEYNQRTAENGRRQPEDRQKADQSFRDTKEKKAGQEQTGSQKADKDTTSRPWEKDGGQETEKARQIDESREPWKRKEFSQSPGEESSKAGRDKDGRQSDGGKEKPWEKESGHGKESGKQPQGSTPTQRGKPNTPPTKENSPKQSEKEREPWRRDRGEDDKSFDKLRQENSKPEESKREETKHGAAQNEPENPAPPKLPSKEPPSNNDGPTKNKDGGYHH